MKLYIGTKALHAKPMTRLDYNILRGWQLPADENGDDEGYLVEYLDGGKPNHPDFEGYLSWSPKEQFEDVYRETDAMSFGLAVEMLKKGFKIARADWNGKGIFLKYIPESCCTEQDGLFGLNVAQWIAMKNVDNQVVPWTCSQSDILADDWMIV